MRVVIDTNVLVSGLISSAGPPAKIVNAVLQGKLIPLVSEDTFLERVPSSTVPDCKGIFVGPLLIRPSFSWTSVSSPRR